MTHPEVLKKAQAEIDTVVGLDRLPDFSHVDSLPFITAIVKETLRWRDIVPIGKVVSYKSTYFLKGLHRHSARPRRRRRV
jgi:cytochrome P450